MAPKTLVTLLDLSPGAKIWSFAGIFCGKPQPFDAFFCIKGESTVFLSFQSSRRPSPLAIACVWLLFLPAALHPAHSCGVLPQAPSVATEVSAVSPSVVCMACLQETSAFVAFAVLLGSIFLAPQRRSIPVRIKPRTAWTGSRLYLRPPPLL